MFCFTTTFFEIGVYSFGPRSISEDVNRSLMIMSKFHYCHLHFFYKGQNGRNKVLRIGINEFDHPTVLSQCKQQ